MPEPKNSKRKSREIATSKQMRSPKKTRALLRISIDGKQCMIRANDLQDPDRLADLENKLRTAKEVSIKDSIGLLEIPPAQRIWLLHLFVCLGDTTRLLDGDDERADIFDLILRMQVDLSDLSRANLWRDAALEAAVVKYPGNLEMPCEAIRRRLKQLGQGVARLDSLVKQARQIMDHLNRAARQSQETATVKDLFPDAPIAEGVRVPPGFSISLSGITQIADDEILIAKQPVLLTERCRNLRDGVVYVTVAWLVEGRWCSKVVPRAIIAARNKIVELAAFGLPITSNNAAALVEFFAALEADNASTLPNAIVTDQQGWLNVDAEEVFFWGDTPIRAASDEDQEENVADVGLPPTVRFLATDAGNQQIADALRQSGEFSAWRSEIQQLNAFPRVLLGLFASLAAPLLKILRIPSFILDYAGETSTGKTTTLRVAASAWGNCFESGPDAPNLVFSWDATPTFLERLPETLQSMPAIVDETKRAFGGRDFVARSIYAFCAGRGRGRGSPDGVRRSGTWVTAMITSGEQPITSFTRDGGTRARVVEVWGSPFGAANETTAGIVRRLQAALQENYGHAGPLFVAWLVAHRAEWKRFRKRFRALRSELMQHAGNRALAMRLCDPLAAICLAEELAHEALNLPDENMLDLCIEILGHVTETDRPAEALRYLHAWVSAHQHQFTNGLNPRQETAHEVVGRWDRPNGPWIGFLPPSLEAILREGKYEDMDGLVASWRDRGWLELEREGRSERTRIRAAVGNDPNARVIAIRRSAIEQVDPPGPDAGEDPLETSLDEVGDDEALTEEDDDEADDESEGDE